MGSAAFNFGPQQSTLTAQADPAAGGGGGGDFGSLFGAILADKMRRQRQLDELRMLAEKKALRAAINPPPQTGLMAVARPAGRPMVSEGPTGGTPEMSSGDQRLRDLQQRAAMQALREQTSPAPMKYTPGGFNMDSHLEMNIAGMTPGQRQAFLPQSASVNRADPRVGSVGSSDWEAMGRRNEAVAAQPRFVTVGGGRPSPNSFYGR